MHTLTYMYIMCMYMYMVVHPGQIIMTVIIHVASLIGKAWSLSFTPINNMAGFSGTHPLNPGVIEHRQYAPSLAANP